MRTAPKILALAVAAHVAGVAEARQIGPPPPTIQFRQVVAIGKADLSKNVREVDIAAGDGKVMVTFIQKGNSIGYSFYDGSAWVEGTVVDGFDDPSVAYGSMKFGSLVQDTFACCFRRIGGPAMETRSGSPSPEPGA